MAVVEVSNSNFEEQVLNCEKVLIDFNADWCGPCQMLKPIVDEVSTEIENVKVVSVNIDSNEVSIIDCFEFDKRDNV